MPSPPVRPWPYRDPDRLIVACGVMTGMWLIAWFLVVLGLVGFGFGVDAPSPSNQPARITCWIVAALLFLASGPVASRMSRRRVLLLPPLVLVAVWGLGVWIAVAA